MKHYLSPQNFSSESPIDSLILTQFEIGEVPVSDSLENIQSSLDCECNNEDLVNGGYGLETKREGGMGQTRQLLTFVRCLLRY